MTDVVRATFSGSDLNGLIEQLVQELPYTKDEPETLNVALEEKPTKGWKSQLLDPPPRGVTVEWAGDMRLRRTKSAVQASFPMALDPATVLKRFAKLPFEVAVLYGAEQQDQWSEESYRAPHIGNEHMALGWGMVFKGEGHENSIVSRRWLEHGPFRTVEGSNDTTLVQFHELDADGKKSLAQAKPGHAWIMAGFMTKSHKFDHDVKGIYSEADKLLRVVINGRDVTDEEMLDACYLRREKKDDKEKPIENVAYCFVDEGDAKRHLEALWLHELECRVGDGKGERRLDDKYKPKIDKPKWV